MLKDRHPEVKPGAQETQQLIRPIAQVLDQNRFDIFLQDPAARQLSAIAFFGQVRMAAERRCSLQHGFLKWQVLERVQRIVVDEGRDRPLRR